MRRTYSPAQSSDFERGPRTNLRIGRYKRGGDNWLRCDEPSRRHHAGRRRNNEDAVRIQVWLSRTRQTSDVHIGDQRVDSLTTTELGKKLGTQPKPLHARDRDWMGQRLSKRPNLSLGALLRYL
jgi:hypothetical protein